MSQRRFSLRSQYLDELKKLKERTDGFLQKKSREAIAVSLKEFAVEAVKTHMLVGEFQKRARHDLLVRAIADREFRTLTGATPGKSPEWKAAMACELWARSLDQGDPFMQLEFNRIILQMIRRVFRFAHPTLVCPGRAATGETELTFFLDYTQQQEIEKWFAKLSSKDVEQFLFGKFNRITLKFELNGPPILP